MRAQWCDIFSVLRVVREVKKEGHEGEAWPGGYTTCRSSANRNKKFVHFLTSRCALFGSQFVPILMGVETLETSSLFVT